MNDMNAVTISAQSFEGLVRDSEKLEFLKNLIIGSIALSYNGRDLRINDDKILDAIRLIDEQAVIQRERFLREEYEKRRKEDEE